MLFTARVIIFFRNSLDGSTLQSATTLLCCCWLGLIEKMQPSVIWEEYIKAYDKCLVMITNIFGLLKICID